MTLRLWLHAKNTVIRRISLFLCDINGVLRDLALLREQRQKLHRPFLAPLVLNLFAWMSIRSTADETEAETYTVDWLPYILTLGWGCDTHCQLF